MSSAWLFLTLAIGAEICATLSLRASDGFSRRRWLIPAAAGYAVAFAALHQALAAGIAVGIAYGIWTAAGIALVALLARAIWKDPLTPPDARRDRHHHPGRAAGGARRGPLIPPPWGDGQGVPPPGLEPGLCRF